MLNEVLVTSSTTLRAYTTTILSAILSKWSTLDVAHMRDGDYHIVISIEILWVELLRRIHNLGTTLIAVSVLHLDKLVLNDLQLHLDTCQYIVEVVNLTLQLGTLILQFFNLQACQLTQTHLGNSRRLNLAQTKTLLQSLLCQIVITRVSDNMYNFVNIILRNDKTLHNMHTLLRLLQIKASTTYNHIVTMLNEVLNQILQVQEHRATVNQRNVVNGKRCLQLGILEKCIEHHISRRIALNLNSDTSTLTVTLIVDMRDTLQLLLIDQLADTLNHLGLIDHIWNLRNDNCLVTCRRGFNLCTSTHHHATTTR